MQLRYNYRLYPTPGQREALARAFGCARVVFNDALRARQDAHAAGEPYITDAELSAAADRGQGDPGAGVARRGVVGGAPAGPRGPERGVPELLRLGHRASARGRRSRRPGSGPARTAAGDRFTANSRFKSWARAAAAAEDRGRGGPLVPRPARPPRPSVTVIRDAAGRYFASFVVEAGRGRRCPETGRRECGIDLGLTHFAVLADGTQGQPRRGSCGARRSKLKQGAAGPVPQGRRAAATGTRPG